MTLPGGVAVFGLDRQGVSSRWIADAGGLEAAARRFTALCATGRSSLAAIDAEGKVLYDALLAPIEARLVGKKMLVIRADGAFNSMPWGALRDKRGTLLLERQAIVIDTGANGHLRPAAPLQKSTDALIVLAPQLSPELARNYPVQENSPHQIAVFSKLFPGSPILAGRNATIEIVKRNLPHSAFFHYGGHGMDANGFGAILLAVRPDDLSGGIFTSQDLKALDLSGVRVATLAACSTGSGQFGGPGNPDSLVRSMLDAGVRNVVAASWDVNTGVTGDLFANFYRELKTGVHPAVALQRVTLALQHREQTSHPYFWAAFQTHGSAN